MPSRFVSLTEAMADGDPEALSRGLRIAEYTLVEEMSSPSQTRTWDPTSVLISVYVAQDHLFGLVPPMTYGSLVLAPTAMGDLLPHISAGLRRLLITVPRDRQEDVTWSIARIDDAISECTPGAR